MELRRKAHSYNETAERKGHPLLKFLCKFWGVSARMLELIMILSVALGRYSDFVVVGALLVVNAVLSFAQEHRAAGVVEALRWRLQVSARVLREASWQLVPAREMVPGDIVPVCSGDIIPADLKHLSGAPSFDQLALTGESKDVDKAPCGVLSSGSVARRGEGNAVVILTGANTYFGRTTELVQCARPKLHVEAAVAKVVRWLFLFVGALLAAVSILSLLRGAALLEMVSLMPVLLMSAVPVALPVMITFSMAFGSKELARRGALVTRPSAAEGAATMDVLCVDKTGTITMNELAVTGVIPLERATEADVLHAGALASQEANLKTAGAQAGDAAVDLLAGPDGFAEVYPEDKYIVVRHLQAPGQVTGMTGDGVNDAPALRQAEAGIDVSSATDVAKSAASVVLTEVGMNNILALVAQGRTIYQRVLTWIINKISRTILKSAFVAIAFVFTGRFVVSALAMLLLVFMTDFAKIALAIDHVRPSKKPETWNIGGSIVVSVVLGMAMVAGALRVWLGWSHLGLAGNDHALHTFGFLTLLYIAAFSIVSAREHRRFRATMPSKALLAAVVAEALAGTALSAVGLLRLTPLPWWQMLAIFAYAMVSCLLANKTVKVAMIKSRVPAAMA